MSWLRTLQRTAVPAVNRLLRYLPRGNMLDQAAWRRRHTFLMWVLFLHLPALFLFGLWLGNRVVYVAWVLLAPTICLLLGALVPHRRVASFFVTAGLVYCSSALVALSKGSIEAHFHFFIVIGFIALYQDWVPFLWDIVFTVLSHGIGSVWQTNLMFNHPAGQTSPWTWSVVHGLAVLAACIGVVVFWRTTEDEQQKTLALNKQLADAELSRRRFTSELLVNLARRNQSMLYRQLDIIGQLEEHERDPDALAELFRLDHLATRIRRNAESLLVLSGEDPPRVWSEPVPLLDVVRAAIAETEDLDRVIFAVDERLSVLGRAVTDLTHVLAELTENAVRFSPPEANVTIRTRPYLQTPGAYVLTVEDWGVGMRPEDLAAANDLLTNPRDVDLSVSQRLGLHVVARLAQRHDVHVSLTPTPGCGVTAVVVLPPGLFAEGSPEPVAVGAHATAAVRPATVAQTATIPRAAPPRRPPPPPGGGNGSRSTADGPSRRRAMPDGDDDADWAGWWAAALPADAEAAEGYAAPAAAAEASGPAAVLPLGADGAAAAAEPRLTRRVPQAHLAPELRQTSPSAAAPPPAAPPSDAARARDALSRYQASRQAARDLVEGHGNGDPGDRDPSAGAGQRP